MGGRKDGRTEGRNKNGEACSLKHAANTQQVHFETSGQTEQTRGGLEHLPPGMTQPLHFLSRDRAGCGSEHLQTDGYSGTETPLLCPHSSTARQGTVGSGLSRLPSVLGLAHRLTPRPGVQSNGLIDSQPPRLGDRPPRMSPLSSPWLPQLSSKISR